jgi:hypothetical protein
MPDMYLSNQRPPRLTIREKVAELTYNTRWFAPLFFALCFALSGGIGLIWGLIVNTAHPPMGDLPLYPGAQAVLDERGNTVTRLDTSTVNAGRPAVSYSFETSASPDTVAAFYEDALKHTYGFINPSVEASGDRGYTIRGLRMALRDRWVLEAVNVTITPVNSSLTRVALSFDIR